MRLNERIVQLERAVNHAPMLVLEIDCDPTPEQAAKINAATRSGRRLLMFIGDGDTVWMPGAGPAPWSAA